MTARADSSTTAWSIAASSPSNVVLPTPGPPVMTTRTIGAVMAG
jgi:hypothetical protein